MPNMKYLSLPVQKLYGRLKLTTDRQIDRQTDKQTDRQDKINMPPIIRSGGIKIIVPCDRYYYMEYMCNMKALSLQWFMAKVKVFVHASHKDADAHARL